MKVLEVLELTIVLYSVACCSIAAPIDSSKDFNLSPKPTTTDLLPYGDSLNLQRTIQIPDSLTPDATTETSQTLRLHHRVKPREVQADNGNSKSTEILTSGCGEPPSCNDSESETECCQEDSQVGPTRPPKPKNYKDFEELFCPGKLNVDDQFKTNTISIGFLGNDVDPAFESQQGEQRKRNSSEPAYNPPVAEYIITLLLQLEKINNRTDILPYHKICLVPSITPQLSKTLENSFKYVMDPNIPVVIDILIDDVSIFAQNVIQPFSLPMVRFGQLRRLQALTESDVLSSFQNLLRVHPTGETTVRSSKPMANDFFKQLRKKFLFTVGPEMRMLHQAVVSLTEVFNWGKIGFIVPFNDEAFSSDESISHTLQSENLTVVFVHLDLKALNNTFRVLIENEIQIVVFQGEPKTYIKLLNGGLQWDYVGKNNVWLFLYDGALFPDEYSDLWQGYSREETFVLKNALSGTLALGSISGIGEIYDQFLKDFIIKARSITGDARVYEENNRFLKTSCVYDSFWVVASALNELVESKADDLGVHPSQVSVTKNDTSDLLKYLHETYIMGATGVITFTKTGKRHASLFDLRNFVPVENDFQVNNSLEVDPWIVQTRGHLKIVKESKSFVYFTENGTASETSTVVFPDGTTNIPSDQPIRTFIRRAAKILITTNVALTLFMGLALFHILVVRYKDKKSLLHNNSWIFKEERIDYSYDIAAQSKLLKGQMGKYQRFSAILKPGAARRLVGAKGIGKLRGKDVAVFITRGEFTEANLNLKIYQEVEQLRALEHPNVCPFAGCILDVSTSALMYEYCSRGSLKNILNSSHYGWIFQLSFALDTAKGLAYLHSKKIFHGRLKASCCVIDEQWNLKITYYGLEELQPKKKGNKRRASCARKWRQRHIAPEVLLLGHAPSPASDVYSYGHILQQIAQHQEHIAAETQQDSVGSHEELIPPKFSKLVTECLEAHPRARPSLESVKCRLYQMSHYFTLFEKSGTGVIQIYSRNLEERLKESAQLLAVENEKATELAYNYIPRAMVDSAKKGDTVPIQEYANTAVLCIEVTNMDELFKKSNPLSIDKTMTTMHKAMEGVLFYHDVQKLHTVGNMWVLVSGCYGSTVSCPVLEATRAAVDILKTFQGIFVHGMPEANPTIRIGFNTGAVACGLLEGTVLQHVSFGEAIQTALKLMLRSRDGCILATATVADKLCEHPNDYSLQLNMDHTMATVVDQGTTFWVNQFEPLSHLTQTATRILVASGSKQPPPPPTSSSSSSSSFKSTPRLRPPQRMASDPTDLLAVSRSPAQNILKILKKNTGGGRQRHHRHSPLLCCQARGNCSCGCYCDSSLNILMGGGGSGSTRQLFLPQVVSSRTRKNNTLTIAE